MLDLNAEYICPYCANNAPLVQYLIKKASGEYNNKRCKCPLCNEGIKLATLKSDMSAHEWGEWIYLNIRVYNSPHFHFYDKWQHDIFFINLNTFPRNVRNDWWEGFKLHKIKGTGIDGLKNRLEELNIKFGIWYKKESVTTLRDFTENMDNEDKENLEYGDIEE
jgi:hypothetical protein